MAEKECGDADAGSLVWARGIQNGDSDTGQFNLLIPTQYPADLRILQSLEGTEGSLHLGAEAAQRPLMQGSNFEKARHLRLTPRPGVVSPLLPGGFPNISVAPTTDVRGTQPDRIRKLSRQTKTAELAQNTSLAPKTDR